MNIAEAKLKNLAILLETIAINAYCIIPRGADGRGFKVISDKAFIMIRGDYTIG